MYLLPAYGLEPNLYKALTLVYVFCFVCAQVNAYGVNNVTYGLTPSPCRDCECCGS